MALTIDEGAEIDEQLGEVRFRGLAAPGVAGVPASNPRAELVGPLAQGGPAPTEFACGTPLPPGPEGLHGLGLKEPAGGAVQRLGGGAEEGNGDGSEFQNPMICMIPCSSVFADAAVCTHGWNK